MKVVNFINGLNCGVVRANPSITIQLVTNFLRSEICRCSSCGSAYLPYLMTVDCFPVTGLLKCGSGGRNVDLIGSKKMYTFVGSIDCFFIRDDSTKDQSVR